MLIVCFLLGMLDGLRLLLMLCGLVGIVEGIIMVCLVSG